MNSWMIRGVPRTSETYRVAAALIGASVDSRPRAPTTARIVAKTIDVTDTKIVIETPPRMNGAHSRMKSA